MVAQSEAEQLNLARIVAKGGGPARAAERVLEELERERIRLEAEQALSVPDLETEALRDLIRSRLIELRGTLDAATEPARAALRSLIPDGERIRVTPTLSGASGWRARLC
jgi:hypothetical protein